jgi:hypothetical protein
MTESRCFVIGDIHGHRAALDELLVLMEREGGLSSSDQIVFLGDYVDRGPDSVGVLEKVHSLVSSRPNTVALIGNHDTWVKPALAGKDIHRWLKGLPEHFWWKQYFFSHAPVYRMPTPEQINTLSREVFFHGLQTFRQAVEVQYDFVYSFAGFDAVDLLREEGMIGVCGHVHHEEIVIYPDHYIGLDTGAGLGGKLSGVRLPDLKAWSVKA